MNAQNRSKQSIELFSMLASSIESGLILCCGNDLHPYCADIAAAMPMTTRLVLNVDNNQAVEQAQFLVRKDIRIAVHKQDHLQFLNDISQYYFNLILIQTMANSKQLITHLINKLNPDGIIGVLNTPEVEFKQQFEIKKWHLLSTHWSDQAILAKRISKNAQPTERRGGRRVRVKKDEDR